MMEASGILKDVILHEMGHVLGIGTLWGVKNLLDVTDAANPLYVGTNGLREYRTLAGSASATGVPVENPGGSGTAGSHWRDSVFRTELMTGYAEPAGVAMPISRITVGSLQDLGYTVNYAAADPYVLPAMTAPVVAARPVTAISAHQRMLALLASSDLGFITAAMNQFATNVTPPATPRQRAFAGSVRV